MVNVRTKHTPPSPKTRPHKVWLILMLTVVYWWWLRSWVWGSPTKGREGNGWRRRAAKREGRGCQGLRGSPSLLILHKMLLGKIVIDKIRYFVSALVYPCKAQVRTENSVHKILCYIREMCFFSLKPELWGHRCLGSKLPNPHPPARNSYPSNQRAVHFTYQHRKQMIFIPCP